MSLFNRLYQNTKSNRRAMLGGAAVIVCALAVSACQMRPLYGSLPSTSTNGAQHEAVQDMLAATDISISSYGSSQDVSRASQYMRNQLIYGFNRGAQQPLPKFKLEIIADKTLSEVGIENLADVPSAYNLTINTTFTLSNIESGKSLYLGRSFASASFDFSNQRFANTRAERDAENRAADMVAEDIQARIAAYFATHP
ncbi:LPS assembly lipoprotein LptE [Polycladidibacter hongkongensis]|uniref:LPS assembly lipoprotein LptE n=1 Tax=Polycladidibacter hongkongensis TaxID=1647556 RepID=UPI00082B8A2D|nr:LPS assembly lipoprotein LptE [Pseudovibrio hongkongensis]